MPPRKPAILRTAQEITKSIAIAALLPWSRVRCPFGPASGLAFFAGHAMSVSYRVVGYPEVGTWA
jgi:hypothetical protein